MTCSCKETTGGSYEDDCPYLMTAYILAGLSMMLNIRLAYSSAPYALIRFQLPENLFSVFVRRMASALEFWCLPSMLLGNIIEIAQRLSAESKDAFKLDHSKQQSQENTKLETLINMKKKKLEFIIIPSMVTMWSDFITYLVLLAVYVLGDQGNVTAYYFVIAVSGFIFGINMVLVYAADWRYIPVYVAGENSFPMLTSIIHYFTTLIYGNRRKYNSDFLIVCIDISVAIIISFVTATLWTYSYGIMRHKSTDKILRFGTSQGWNPYDITRNTSLTFNVNLNGTNKFASNGSITITVGGTNFTQLSTGTISISTGTIKKYVGDTPQDINGTSETLPTGTKLDIDATGSITNISGSEVTIKGTVTVSSEGKTLDTTLTITHNDPSSEGLGGTITPTGSGNKVTINPSSNITLAGNALDDINSLTKNAVTLSDSGGFKSSASITVTSTDGNVDFRELHVDSQGLQITSITGSIKNSDGSELKTGTQLKVDTKLSLDASGKISEPDGANNAAVKLTGTIVVTSNNKQIGTSGLKFGGGPSTGVTGTLTLEDDSGKKYVKIQTSGSSSSTLTIQQAAYQAIPKTETSFTIGAADPRDPTKATGATGDADSLWHLLPSDKYDPNDLPDGTVASPTLMVIIGMGFVYCIYPGIAPGMIVPFYLVDKIETVLLVLTTFPPVIIAILQKLDDTKGWSPKTTIRKDPPNGLGGWSKYTHPYSSKSYDTTFYHAFDILMIIKMTLLVIFIYCLHYRDSSLSRSIVNQPKMSTFLTIVFYMCHECLLALGFAGVIGNNGATYVVLPAQYVGALLMIFLAFYSEGYIIEYKSHDPAHWPTEGMTKWNAFCYWCKRASKITNHNLRSLFTTDLRRDLLLCIQKNELI